VNFMVVSHRIAWPVIQQEQDTITEALWRGRVFLNEMRTRNFLKQNLQNPISGNLNSKITKTG